MVLLRSEHRRRQRAKERSYECTPVHRWIVLRPMEIQLSYATLGRAGERPVVADC
jgi:hypothetical protein